MAINFLGLLKLSMNIIIHRFLKPAFFVCFFLIFCIYFFGLLIFLISCFSVLFKFIFLMFFFFFNIFSFFFFLNVYDFLFLFLDWSYVAHFDSSILIFLKVLLIFVFDLVIFLKSSIILLVDPRNFLGVFFSFFQFLNELVYEAIFQFVEQTEEHVMVPEINWMPRYIFGDMLERTFRFNKILNLFKFSDLFYEKNFVYKRVGVLNSRFWIFRHYNLIKRTDFRFRKTIGNFVEPDRWLLNFRDLKLSDYLDPWNFFSHQSVFRDSRESLISPIAFKKGNYISVQLLHNYYSIMETRHINPSERVYSDYYSSSFFFYEIALIFFLYTYLFATIELHLQFIFLELDADDPELIDKGDTLLNMHPYIEYWNVNDSVEAKFFSKHPLDIYEYTQDDDLSWDFLLSQPKTLQFHNPSDLDEFKTFKEFNSLFDEFRTFSFMYPFYRLMLKLAPYKGIDFFLFTDSAKCFRIIFFVLLYFPIGFIIISFKCFINVFDLFLKFPFISFIFCIFCFICFLFFF